MIQDLKELNRAQDKQVWRLWSSKARKDDYVYHKLAVAHSKLFKIYFNKIILNIMFLYRWEDFS